MLNFNNISFVGLSEEEELFTNVFSPNSQFRRKEGWQFKAVFPNPRSGFKARLKGTVVFFFCLFVSFSSEETFEEGWGGEQNLSQSALHPD